MPTVKKFLMYYQWINQNTEFTLAETKYKLLVILLISINKKRPSVEGLYKLNYNYEKKAIILS